MAPFALFGITNDALNLVVSLLALFVAAIWLALVFWTFMDARRRVGDLLLVGCATAASLLFPFVGTIIYMILRPPEYLDDVRERELEIAAAEARLHSLEIQACPYCDFEIEKSFLRCPSCLRRLKEPCRSCGKPLDPRWKICPFCEAEVASGQARGRARPSGRASAGRSRPAAPTGRSAGGGGPAAEESAPAGGAVSPPAG